MSKQLTTRVSDETAVKFDELRAQTPLSVNQFLKFLVLCMDDELEMPTYTDWEDIQKWLRGK